MWFEVKPNTAAGEPMRRNITGNGGSGSDPDRGHSMIDHYGDT
jgi:hypothetical protein